MSGVYLKKNLPAIIHLVILEDWIGSGPLIEFSA